MARFVSDNSVVASVSQTNPGIVGHCPCPWMVTSPKPVERRASFDALSLIAMTIPAHLRAMIATFIAIGECRTGAARSMQLIVRDFGELRQMPQQADLQRAIPMDRNRQTDCASMPAINVMAAAYPQQPPAAQFEKSGQVVARQRLHIAISSTRPFTSALGSATSTDKHPSIASRRFCRSSSMVSPWVAQPGIAGTSAQ